jgi:hypothetical protein
MSALRNVPGYDTGVLFNNEWLNYENFGFLNNQNSGRFTIFMKLKESMASTYEFSVTPIYRVDPNTKNITPIDCVSEKFEFDIPVHSNGPGKWGYTTNNTVRFIAYNDRVDICEYEVGVFTQRGKHFFGMQRNWQDRLCLNAEGQPVIENVKWDQLAKFLASTLNIRPQGIARDKPQTEQRQPVPTNELAIVRWFKFATGTGAIETSKGMAKVHYSNILTRDRHRPAILQPNQRVKTTLISAQEAAGNSKHQISFPWVATEVQPVW